MDMALICITFIHNYAAGFIMPWLGLLLVNIKPDMKKIAIVALCYAVLGVLLRSVLIVPYDIGFYIQIFLLVVAVILISQLGPLKAIVATFLGVIILALGELISLIIMRNIFGQTYDTINNVLVLLFVPLPQILMALLIIYLCMRTNFHLFNFIKISHRMTTFESKRTKMVVSLISILLLVIVVQLIFSATVINQITVPFQGLPLPIIGMISVTVLILGVIAMILLIIQLLELTEKENQYDTQAVYIDTLDELYTAIRSERHDIINHLQTVYGFCQLDNVQEAKNYLHELMGGNILSNEFIITGTPGLTALFYIKSGIARTNDIKFNVDIRKKIDSLKVSPYELNNILGNLINNAFDAVISLENSKRVVNVDIGANEDHYVLKVANYGYISDDIKQKILRKGYSTKTGQHSGLGLYICEKLINKYEGRMEINNGDNHMVEFSVFLPLHMEEMDLYETPGKKKGSFNG